MENPRYVPMLQAQESLPALVESSKGERIVLTQNGETPVAVLISIDEFRSIQAMLELSGDIERLAKLYETQQRIQQDTTAVYESLI